MPERSDESSAEKLKEFLRRANQPPSVKTDGVLKFGRGTRDVDQPFEETIQELIHWIDEMLIERGVEPASNGRWGNIRSSANPPAHNSPSEVYALANLSGAAQRAHSESDPNRKLNWAFQLGWDAAMEKHGRIFGTNTRLGKKTAISTSEGGRSTRKYDHGAIIQELRAYKRRNPNHSKNAAHKKIAKEFDCHVTTVARIDRKKPEQR